MDLHWLLPSVLGPKVKRGISKALTAEYSEDECHVGYWICFWMSNFLKNVNSLEKFSCTVFSFMHKHRGSPVRTLCDLHCPWRIWSELGLIPCCLLLSLEIRREKYCWKFWGLSFLIFSYKGVVTRELDKVLGPPKQSREWSLLKHYKRMLCGGDISAYPSLLIIYYFTSFVVKVVVT